MWSEHLQRELARIQAAQLTRRTRVAHSGTAPTQQVAGAQGCARELLMFCSNDYLGLAAHPAVAQALADGAQRWGGGSGASPLVSGHTAAHAALGDWLAQAYAPHIPQARALGFCTGYLANIAALSALGDAGTLMCCERLNHASLIDGARLSRAERLTYPHADLATLAQQLAQRRQGRRALIVTDAVFSMDGDHAPLRELLALAEAHDALLVVDDAHGFGVRGASGLGSLQALGLRSERLVLIGTLGKAAGLAGAFVVAHDAVAQYLLQTARPYIFSTATPPALEHALLASLRLVSGPEGQRRRERLAARVAQLRQGLVALLQRHPGLGWRLPAVHGPIQPLIVGGNAVALRLAERLEQAGLRVPAIRPPTVPEGTARLRITVCAEHTAEEVDRLLQALALAAHESEEVLA